MTAKKKDFTKADFRDELLKWMPGYKWTVSRDYMKATGIQSAGLNRMSTMIVERNINKNGIPWYNIEIYGVGTKGPCLGREGNITLASALRDLHNHLISWNCAYGGAVKTMELCLRRRS